MDGPWPLPRRHQAPPRASVDGPATHDHGSLPDLGGAEIARRRDWASGCDACGRGRAGRAAGLDAPPAVFRARDTGAVLWDCADCPELVVTPAGAYTLGSPDNEPFRAKDEGPRTRITLARALAVSRFEVTRGEYE